MLVFAISNLDLNRLLKFKLVAALRVKNNFSHPAFIGFLFAALATLIWSGNFLIARGLNTQIEPVSLAFWRWTIATVFILPVGIKSMYSQRELLKKHLLFLTITSILGISIFNTLIYVAGQTSSALNLSLISITFPVFTIVLSRVFLRESITKFKVAGVLVIIFGLILLLSKGDPKSLLSLSFTIGDLWMLLASFIFAVYSLLVKRRPLEIMPLSFLGSTFLTGWLFLAAFYVFTTDRAALSSYGSVTIYSVFYVGIFASIVAYFLWNRSVDLLGPSKASMIYYMIPVFSGILAFLFLGEKVGWIHLTSGVLIVSGILIANRKAGS